MSWSVTLVVSGTNQGCAARPVTSSFDTSQPTRESATSRSLVCTTPTMLSGSSFHRGMRVCWLFSTSSTTFCGGIVDVDGLHLGAMDHDVEHLQAAQVEHAAEHRRIALGDRAADGLQLDGAADLLVRGQDIGGVVALGRRQLQEQAHDELDGRRSAG